MNLTVHVDRLGREFAAVADAGDDEVRALVEHLSGSLESAIRLTLLEALSAAADEITRELAPGSAELRLRGRDPYFVVTPARAAPPTVDSGTAITEDGPSARINVRLPEQLKAAVEAAAAAEGRSVNTWFVRAASSALHRSDHAGEGGKRAEQSFRGWAQ